MTKSHNAKVLAKLDKRYKNTVFYQIGKNIKTYNHTQSDGTVTQRVVFKYRVIYRDGKAVKFGIISDPYDHTYGIDVIGVLKDSKKSIWCKKAIPFDQVGPMYHLFDDGHLTDYPIFKFEDLDRIL